MSGLAADGELNEVQLHGGKQSSAPTGFSNYAFDVTPANLVTGLITERGVCAAKQAELCALFPERVDEAGGTES